MKKSKRKLVVAALVFFSISLLVASPAQAKPKLNKAAKTITVGKSYILKVKKIKTKNIKKVMFKEGNKKVVSVKKLSNKAVKIVARKKGKTTVKAVIRYRKKVNGKKKYVLKCHIKVINEKLISIEDDSYPFVSDEYSQSSVSGNTIPYAKVVVETPDIKKSTIANRYGYYEIYYENLNRWDAIVTAYDNMGNIIKQQKVYYFKDHEKVEQIIEQVKKECNISENSSDIEKAKVVAEWLCKHITYNSQYIWSCMPYTLYSGYAVCGGYADTYQYLMNNVFQVECRYISYNPTNHAWNQVKLDNKWYNVDVTWMDEDATDSINYSYFLLSAKRLSEIDARGIHDYYSDENLKKLYPADDTRFDDFTLFLSDDIDCGWEYRNWWNSEEWKTHL